MRKKDLTVAIGILRQQVVKGDEPNLHFDSWYNQSKSLIEKYFSTESTEFKWFERKVFSDAHYGIDIAEFKRKEQIQNIKDTQAHLRAATETLMVKDITKDKKLPIAARINNTLLSIIATIILGSFGWLLSKLYDNNVTIMELKNEIKQRDLLPAPTSNNISPDKSSQGAPDTTGNNDMPKGFDIIKK